MKQCKAWSPCYGERCPSRGPSTIGAGVLVTFEVGRARRSLCGLENAEPAISITGGEAICYSESGIFFFFFFRKILL